MRPDFAAETWDAVCRPEKVGRGEVKQALACIRRLLDSFWLAYSTLAHRPSAYWGSSSAFQNASLAADHDDNGGSSEALAGGEVTITREICTSCSKDRGHTSRHTVAQCGGARV